MMAGFYFNIWDKARPGQETDGGGNWNGCCLELEGIMGLKTLATAPPQPSKTLFCLISRAYIVPTQTKNGLQSKP
jgi:hypothetical protein